MAAGTMMAMLMGLLVGAAEPPSPSPAPDPPPKSAVEQARDAVEQTQQLYDQSCGDRAYGSYDDLCNDLAAHVRQSRITLDQLERDEGRKAKPSAPKP